MENIFKNKRRPRNQDGKTPVSNQLSDENLIIQNILDQFPLLVWVKNKQHQYYYNQALCDYIGQALPLQHSDASEKFIHPDDYSNFSLLWQHALHTQQGFEQECRIQHGEKDYRICLISVQPVQHLDNIDWMVTATDIHDHYLKHTELHQQVHARNKMLNASINDTQPLTLQHHIPQQEIVEKNLQQLIELDELTGLYNRSAFNKILKKTIQNAQQQQQSVGFLLIDLDYFKHINDTLGHIAGDYLLQILGQRLRDCFNEQVVLSRLGGDEFSIIVPHLKDESELLNLAKIARQQLDIPICYAGQYINGGMSIGGAMYPQHAKNSSMLLRCADVALNDLKMSGRGGIRMFQSTMFKSIQLTTKQLALARAIIHRNKIFPVYQPKVNLADGKVISFEALLRWYDADDQIQLPSHIFSAFQDYELATQISEIMQLKVFQDMNRWLAAGLELLPVSINAAPVEFLRDNYAEKLLSRIAQFKIPHSLIEIEITEQSLSDRGSDYVIRALKLLKQAGLSISLDDFGTGHSSLTRLRDYPVDCLKIDRNFIKNMHTDPSALAIVQAISQIGNSISLDILVEGIEKKEQVEALQACDCHSGQGFYFYHPMIFQDATQLLKPVAHTTQPISSSS